MSNETRNKSGAGKGDKPRPINLDRYGSNYDQIKWPSKKEKKCPKVPPRH